MNRVSVGMATIFAAGTVAHAEPAMPIAPSVSAQAQTILHCGRMVDVRKPAVTGPVSIVLQGKKILRIDAGHVMVPAASKAIDLKTQTCMPGWIDLHVHLSNRSNPNSQLERYTFNAADWALQGVQHAQRTLMAGFTTVRDMAAPDSVNIALKRAVERGVIPGPRIFAAGWIVSTTGGHGDATNGFRQGLQMQGNEPDVVDSPADARRLVRQRYKEGADVVKITTSGGVLSYAASGDNPQFQQDELQALVATARDYGLKVAAHSHGAEGAKRAVLAGVDSIEHGTLLDDEALELMKKHGTYLVPTISAGETVAEKSRIPGYFPEIIRLKAQAIGPQIKKSFTNAYRKGVKIAFGTDSGVGPHGSNWMEFVYMVDAGMPALEAIQSATWTAAKVLGAEDRFGTLEPGMFADIVATPRDPSQDIQTVGQVSFVMKEGIVYKQP